MLILGDSIAFGTPLGADDRWDRRLADLLAAELPERRIDVDNWAVPGARVDLLEAALQHADALASFDVVVVIEGVNDIGPMSVDAWTPRYRAAIAGIEAIGPTVIVGTPPPTFEDGEFKTRYDGVAAAIRMLGRADRPVLDIAGHWREQGPKVASAYYADLIHQSAIGQAAMAEVALPLVLSALEGPDRP